MQPGIDRNGGPIAPKGLLILTKITKHVTFLLDRPPKVRRKEKQVLQRCQRRVMTLEIALANRLHVPRIDVVRIRRQKRITFGQRLLECPRLHRLLNTLERTGRIGGR